MLCRYLAEKYYKCDKESKTFEECQEKFNIWFERCLLTL